MDESDRTLRYTRCTGVRPFSASPQRNLVTTPARGCDPAPV